MRLSIPFLVTYVCVPTQIVCHSTTTFIAHLVNQSVAHEIIALQILVLLLERPTDDSIEIAVGFMREVGAYLSEHSPKANASVFERFRAVLNEGALSHRVQYMIEVLMQVRKDKFKDNPIIPEGLDLVEEDEQITHQIQLEEELQVQEGLSACDISLLIILVTNHTTQIFSRWTLTTLKMRKSTRPSRRRFSERARTTNPKKKRSRKKRTRVSEFLSLWISIV